MPNSDLRQMMMTLDTNFWGALARPAVVLLQTLALYTAVRMCLVQCTAYYSSGVLHV